ncbi:reprolysin-like metallopeptidase [Catenovulum agarivorans]|uniref:reprolysin-like metallopeptidase n=1 Tax=Catenovulum agarivorans TaxID=1172192 RepID=UPI0002FC19AA|nr:zinc-dependent metalloprotease family protein [Catenovulum agarivorans]
MYFISLPTAAWQILERPNTLASDVEVTSNVVDKAQAIKLAADDSSQKLLATLSNSTENTFVVQLPTATGELVDFNISRTNEITGQLQQDYPQIKSFKGHQVSDPTQLARITIGPNGFYAMYLLDGQVWYLDPDTNGQYQLYTGHSDLKHDEVLITEQLQTSNLLARGPLSAEPGIVTYRIAVAATGEYTQFYNNKTNALNGIVTTINRVNLLFERDLAIQLQLIDNNDLLIFTNASTDPFANDDPDADIAAAQQTIDNIIGSSNYDLGHVFATDGGGLAQVGAVCRSGLKAQAMTGTPRPQGDSFNVDFVAHEIGHQLGALHTFNGTAGFCDGGRIDDSAYELGGGVTIMGYAGICSDNSGNENVRTTSIANFHFQSISEIHNYVRFSGGRNCGTHQTSDNLSPTVNAGSDKTIPANTPFVLTGQANDANQDSLIYTWEQYDLGTATSDKSDWGTSGDGPIFRNYAATTSPARYIPNIQDLIFLRSTSAELLPSTSRQMTFKFVAKDQKGGVAHDELTVNVRADTGPFVVTKPSGGEDFVGRQLIDVNWQVNGTDNFCSQVNILMNTDLDDTFEYTLAANTPNDGQQQIELPNTTATQAKLMVICASQQFFNLNSGFFSIAADLQPLITGQNTFEVDQGENFTISINDLVIDNPTNSAIEVIILNGTNYTVSDNVITITNAERSEVSINVQVSNGTDTSNIFSFSAKIQSDTPDPIEPEAENENSADVTINIKAGSSGTTNLYLLMVLLVLSLAKSYRNSPS